MTHVIELIPIEEDTPELIYGDNFGTSKSEPVIVLTQKQQIHIATYICYADGKKRWLSYYNHEPIDVVAWHPVEL